MANTPEHPRRVVRNEEINPKILILAEGKKAPKAFRGQDIDAAPIAGTFSYGTVNVIGVGVKVPEVSEPIFLAEPGSRRLIQAYRGMKLMEYIPSADPEVVIITHLAAGVNTPTDIKKESIRTLSGLIGRKKLIEVRSKVLRQVPPADELNRMLNVLNDNNFGIDGDDIEREIKAGRIAASPLIDKLTRMAVREREEESKREAELEIPIPQDRSLSVLFRDLGIKNLIAGDTRGRYGDLWQHVSPDNFENALRRRVYSNDKPYPIRVMDPSGETPRQQIVPGVEYSVISYEKIRYPSMTGPDSTQFTFTDARFTDGTFMVGTVITSPGGEETEKTLPVPELRKLLSDAIKVKEFEKKATIYYAPESTTIN